MRRRQGYTKRVLLAQVGKYEEALKCSDSAISDFSYDMGCPVCKYRLNHRANCKNDNRYCNCLAVCGGLVCLDQAWWNEKYKALDEGDIKRLRQILKTRLKYWKRIYAEKYPEAK